ncbi:MAG: sigma factor-like helix-turn-helix DNA-binding protein, partial [Myxococcota bacterium]
ALCELPLDQQLLLEMYYWENMQIADLAAMFEIAPTTVRTRLFRARQLLREQLARAEGKAEPVNGDDGDGNDDEAAKSFDTWVRSLRSTQPKSP